MAEYKEFDLLGNTYYTGTRPLWVSMKEWGKIIALWGFILYVIGAYVVNAIQFATSDFERPYKQEVIKGLGLVPPFILMTSVAVWFNFDEDKTGENK